jgi:hypothetical protein
MKDSLIILRKIIEISKFRLLYLYTINMKAIYYILRERKSMLWENYTVDIVFALIGISTLLLASLFIIGLGMTNIILSTKYHNGKNKRKLRDK